MNISSLISDISTIKHSSYLSLFCSGLKHKVENLTSSNLIPAVATAALVTLTSLSAAAYSLKGYRIGDYESGHKGALLFTGIVGGFAVALKNGSCEELGAPSWIRRRRCIIPSMPSLQDSCFYFAYYPGLRFAPTLAVSCRPFGPWKTFSKARRVDMIQPRSERSGGLGGREKICRVL